jgi:hypothetical protein
MTDAQFLLNVKAIIEELCKNAAHSSGIDFERLNLTAIETNKRIFTLGIVTRKKEE